MAGRLLGCCAAAALLLHLTCVSAIQKLNDINDLMRIQFGQSVPRHSLRLLHWFANRVDVLDSEIRLNFNPNSNYGAHHYGNFDGILPQPPAGYHYYTVGNLNKEGAQQLPGYVRYQPHDNDGYNRARIIFRVRGETIDRVYLTQHGDEDEGSSYDSNRTYEIPARLLREVGRLSIPMDGFQPAVRPRECFDCIRDLVKWACMLIIIIVIISGILSSITSKN